MVLFVFVPGKVKNLLFRVEIKNSLGPRRGEEPVRGPDLPDVLLGGDVLGQRVGRRVLDRGKGLHPNLAVLKFWGLDGSDVRTQMCGQMKFRYECK